MTAKKPETKIRKMRAVRVEDDIWIPALAKAEERGESLSDVLRRALERYVKRS